MKTNADESSAFVVFLFGIIRKNETYFILLTYSYRKIGIISKEFLKVHNDARLILYTGIIKKDGGYDGEKR